ncbi:cleft lip and palate transmembrane protein 1-like protein [Plutella xylostella]|uniref:cleft lip and palate transmembrane protein 1-like protein n=1 Tax=Plutella xylostella TaxID=51655 RepID=UPI002032EF6F|nr:cleft lip and palate transmembrane protein 1-like protein [Plutella xylostella]
MKYISFSLILTLIFAGYVVNTIWTLAEIFIPPECSRGEKCFPSYLSSKPKQHLVLYTSVRADPYMDTSSDKINKIHTALNFDYEKEASFDIKLRVPAKTRNNGTLFLHAMLLDEELLYREFYELRESEAVLTTPLVMFVPPRAATFNLLQQQDETPKPEKEQNVQPYAHISTSVPLAILTDKLKLPAKRIPGELYPYMRIRYGKFLPIITHNILRSRMSHLQLLNSTTKTVNMTITIGPTSYGSLRLALHVQLALEHLKTIGFSEKDVDDVKGIFADTNLYLLSATVLIASIHLLFDFLAFKNDVSFWRRARSLAGLSARSVLWRGGSQLVVLLFLLDERSSALLLLPAAVSAAIELWKVTKVLHLRISFTGWRPHVYREVQSDAGEAQTAKADAEAMRYLSMLLYPLCVAGAVYSLIYEPHKSWYSWALHSTVNGVYAFGFLFMLPQLFVNYRLRSVAALPWRAFMYKAFNTFIDDVFAFAITMPTAHRVACFRDDLVFLVYLYQRWLYPVDKSRTDNAASMDENPEELEPAKSKQE